MKQKGVRDPAVGVRHRETTRDERLRVISLRENARWAWRQIGRELRINPRTASRIYHRYNQYSTLSNRKRTGRPPTFDDEEKARLVAFITRDSRTRRLSWEAICIEMDYACDPKTVRNVMISLGYHKRVPRAKFNVKSDNKPKRVAWCQARLHWTREEWKRVIWTDESSFSMAGVGHRPWGIQKADEVYHSDRVILKFHSGRKSKMVWGPSVVQQSLILSSFPAERSSTPQPMYEWSLSLLLCRFGISVARNTDGLLCKTAEPLQGIKGMPKPTES